jgi:hypothetical protein
VRSRFPASPPDTVVGVLGAGVVVEPPGGETLLATGGVGEVETGGVLVVVTGGVDGGAALGAVVDDAGCDVPLSTNSIRSVWDSSATFPTFA